MTNDKAHKPLKAYSKHINELLVNVRNNTPTTLISMPGIGIKGFIDELVVSDSAFKWVVIDSNQIAGISSYELIHIIAKEIDPKLSTGNDLLEYALNPLSPKVCVVVMRIDRIAEDVGDEFFLYMRSLFDQSSKISLVFTANQALYEIMPATAKNTLILFGAQLYLPIFDESIIRHLMEQYKFHYTPEQYRLAGGHHHLLRIISLLDIHSVERAAIDRAVQIICRDLTTSLKTAEQNSLYAIATGGKTRDKRALEYLLALGWIRPVGDEGWEIFSPIVTHFVLSNKKHAVMPVQEKKLFQQLYMNKGRVVTKQAIIENVWGPNSYGEISDWALNALVYRLRKHPKIVHGGYVITSHKKQGYSLND
jgi:hypothetical protein